MTDEFTLSVNYKGQEHHFNARLILQGYSHKFLVLINETEVFFEPDEEGCYRAVTMPHQDEKQLAKIDTALLGIIQQKIESVLA